MKPRTCRRQFDFTPEDIVQARKWITGMARIVKPAVQLDVIKEDPPDNRILEYGEGKRESGDADTAKSQFFSLEV